MTTKSERKESWRVHLINYTMGSVIGEQTAERCICGDKMMQCCVAANASYANTLQLKVSKAFEESSTDFTLN